MDRHRVAAVGVDDQIIEQRRIARALARDRDPPIALDDVHLRLAARDEREVLAVAGQVDHGGVDLEESEVVARLAVGRERAGAEPDHADLDRDVGFAQLERDLDARVQTVVGGRLVLETLDLCAVHVVPCRSERWGGLVGLDSTRSTPKKLRS